MWQWQMREIAQGPRAAGVSPKGHTPGARGLSLRARNSGAPHSRHVAATWQMMWQGVIHR